MSNTITTQTTKRKAAITGCGIAGPVLAMFLRRAGIDSVTYEGRPEPGDEAGAFLRLAPNGRNVPATLGIWDEIDALRVSTTKIAFLNHEGKRLGGNPQPILDFRIAGPVRGQLAPPSASPPRIGGLSGVVEFESWPCI